MKEMEPTKKAQCKTLIAQKGLKTLTRIKHNGK